MQGRPRLFLDQIPCFEIDGSLGYSRKDLGGLGQSTGCNSMEDVITFAALIQLNAAGASSYAFFFIHRGGHEGEDELMFEYCNCVFNRHHEFPRYWIIEETMSCRANGEIRQDSNNLKSQAPSFKF